MPLDRVTITRVYEGEHVGWFKVTRERKGNGETFYAKTLQEGFDYIFAIYDNHGNLKR